MKIIVNKYIPFHGFIAMAFYNILLWRKECQLPPSKGSGLPQSR